MLDVGYKLLCSFVDPNANSSAVLTRGHAESSQLIWDSPNIWWEWGKQFYYWIPSNGILCAEYWVLSSAVLSEIDTRVAGSLEDILPGRQTSSSSWVDLSVMRFHFRLLRPHWWDFYSPIQNDAWQVLGTKFLMQRIPVIIIWSSWLDESMEGYRAFKNDTPYRTSWLLCN